MGLNCCLGLIKILQIRLSIGRACLLINRTRQILKSSFCSLYVLVCSRFTNCSKLLEPNTIQFSKPWFGWQEVVNEKSPKFRNWPLVNWVGFSPLKNSIRLNPFNTNVQSEIFYETFVQMLKRSQDHFYLSLSPLALDHDVITEVALLSSLAGFLQILPPIVDT